MTRSTSTRCQGKRRMMRGHTWGLFKCGRKATTVMTTKVGYSETHYVCDDGECSRGISGGYPASYRAL